MLGYYLRLALASMRRTPGLVMLMVLSLAVGVAASMITLTLRHVLSMDPIPGKSARLLMLQNPAATSAYGRMFSGSDALALGRLAGGRAEPVAFGAGVTTTLTVTGSSRVLRGGVGIRYATASFFRVFDVPLLHGRSWTPAEAQSAAPVAVLGQEMARELFGDDAAVGRQFSLGTAVYTVIGVAGYWNPQPRYYDLDSIAGAFGGGGDAIFLPLTAMRAAPDDLMVSRACPGGPGAMAKPAQLLDMDCRWLSVWYLANTDADAQALRRSLPAALSQILPPPQARALRLLDVPEVLARAGVVPAPVRVYAWLGLAFLALCLLNAAGMQLSRVSRAAAQTGIRRALGASRAQIVGQYLCDTVLIAGMGGVLGMGLTLAGLAAVRRLPDVYYAELARLDGTMLGAMLALVALCGVLVGALPAWLASRVDPAVLIKVPQ